VRVIYVHTNVCRCMYINLCAYIYIGLCICRAVLILGGLGIRQLTPTDTHIGNEVAIAKVCVCVVYVHTYVCKNMYVNKCTCIYMIMYVSRCFN